MSPTVLRSGPYRVFLYSADRGEPRHVHVERDKCQAKFWLDPVRYHRSTRFREPELQKIQDLVEEHAHQLRKAWDEHFTD